MFAGKESQTMENRREKRHTIAIMIGDTQSDYSEDLLRGFYTCAREENVNIVFLMGPQIPQYCMDILACNLEGDYNYQFDTIYDYVHLIGADALIVAYGSIAIFQGVLDKKVFLEKYARIPYLILEDISEDDNVPYLISDNYHSMRECIEHLAVHHGYKKIAFLSGPKVNRDAIERLSAYCDVMKEQGLTVKDSMIAYGNYTEQTEEQVRYLLDNNTGLEAIACANDNMAKACYKVCQERNLIIGKDIAVTGFDDADVARTMNPPLTSVAQSSFRFSCTALKNAIALCEGKKVSSLRMPTVLQQRLSCGCSRKNLLNHTYVSPEQMEQFILKTAETAASEMLAGIPYKKERSRYISLMVEYFHYIYRTVCIAGGEEFQLEYLLDILKQFTAYPHVSSIWLSECISDLIQVLIANIQDVEKQKKLSCINSETQQFIHAFNRAQAEQNMTELNRKAWFVPSFTRDLNRRGSRDDLREVLIPVMKRFRMMNVKSCYIYLFKEPLVHEEREHFEFSGDMYLTAYFNRDSMECYTAGECPRVMEQNGFSSFILEDEPAILTSFLLFSGEKQYGMMLCEVEQKDISFLQICGLQFGSLLRYLEMNWMEQESHQELQDSMKVIQEQNNILSFISEYDELSQLLNRRGFMERAISRCEQNVGKRAYLIFCDLDHLKEINDCFGHTAGDCALRAAADRLRKVLPADAVTARIGGDEFVSLVVSEAPGFKEAVAADLLKAGEQFNSDSDMPYYVEFSMGVYEFFCEARVEPGELIRKSDELLYQAKKNRRKSIKKDISCESP